MRASYIAIVPAHLLLRMSPMFSTKLFFFIALRHSICMGACATKSDLEWLFFFLFHSQGSRCLFVSLFEKFLSLWQLKMCRQHKYWGGHITIFSPYRSSESDLGDLGERGGRQRYRRRGLRLRSFNTQDIVGIRDKGRGRKISLKAE